MTASFLIYVAILRPDTDRNLFFTITVCNEGYGNFSFKQDSSQAVPIAFQNSDGALAI